MRFITAAVALFASVALAQQNAISIPEGQSTLEVTAGQSTTIEWTNPSDGTVTIKLQESGPNITPESGITVASGIPASDGTATFIIDPSQVNTFQYTIEIIDDSDPTNINFSPNFGIAGATGTTTGTVTSASETGSSTATDSTATDSTATDSTATDLTATSTATDSTSTTSASETSTSEESSTSSSAEATQTTSAPSSDDNGAAGLKVQGGLVAAIAVAVAVF